MTDTVAGYRVVGACAHVKTMTAQGPMIVMLFKDQIVPSDAPAETIAHLLSVNLIRPFFAPVAEVDPVTVVDDSGEGKGAQLEAPAVDPEVEEARAAARAKLPTDGSAPDGRSAREVLIEYLATKGYQYSELVKADKADLIALMRG